MTKHPWLAAVHRQKYLFIMLFFSYLLVFFQFLQEHWVHDAYSVAQAGYGHMPQPLFSQGRVFSALFYLILQKLAVPFTAAMAITVFLSLLFLTLAVLAVYENLDGLRGCGLPGQAVAIIGGCVLLINLFIPEFFLFFETAIMCLGILLTVLAAVTLVRAKGLRGYAVSLIFLTAAMFCYQGDVAFFPPLVICLLAAFRKRFCVTALVAALVYVVACLSNLLFLRLLPVHTRVSQADYLLNLSRCMKLLGQMFRDCFHFLPSWWFLVLVVLAAVTLAVTCFIEKRLAPFLFAVLSCLTLIVCALLPLILLDSGGWYAVPRAVVAFAGMPGLILLFLPRAGRWQMAIAAVIMIVVLTAQVDLQWNNRKNSAMDAAEITQIVQTIREYERARGIPFTRIEVTRDASPVYHRPDVRDYGDATLRILSVSWMSKPMLSHALGGSVEVVAMPQETVQRLFAGKNWDELNPEQFMIEGNVLYLCVY